MPLVLAADHEPHHYFENKNLAIWPNALASTANYQRGRQTSHLFFQIPLFLDPWFSGSSLQTPPLHLHLGPRKASVLPTDVLVFLRLLAELPLRVWELSPCWPCVMTQQELRSLSHLQLNETEPTPLPSYPTIGYLAAPGSPQPSELCLENHSSHKTKVTFSILSKTYRTVSC